MNLRALLQHARSLFTDHPLTGFANTDAHPDEITLTKQHIAILSLLHETDGELTGKQRLQKLVFLTDDESTIDTLYEYRKYDYGPYSKQLTTDSRWLAKNDLIHIRKDRTIGGNIRYVYTITETGEQALETGTKHHENTVSPVVTAIQKTVSSHSNTPILNIIDQVRESHPEYWENTVYRTRM